MIIDVDSSPELQEDHGGYVPVVLIDGRRFAAYHVDAAAFIARLGETGGIGPSPAPHASADA